MIGLSRILAPVRGLGRERLSLLASVTGGHAVIHWFQQIFPIMIPAITDEFGLSGIQVGYVGAARQVGAATGAGDRGRPDREAKQRFHAGLVGLLQGGA